MICGLPYFSLSSSSCVHSCLSLQIALTILMTRGSLRTRLIQKLITTIPMEVISSKRSQSGESLLCLCLGDVLPNT